MALLVYQLELLIHVLVHLDILELSARIVSYLNSTVFHWYELISILFKVNGCFNNPCLNGATCTPNGNTYTCYCAQFYSGSNCGTCKQTKYTHILWLFLKIFSKLLVNNACDSGPCLNGATCTNTGSGLTYLCSCPGGYSGNTCQNCKENNRQFLNRNI